MRAIVLAAGEGKRLRPRVADRPKCLVELLGKPLLLHQIQSLQEVGIGSITIVTGYRSDLIEAFGHDTRHNPDFASTNMVSTLMCAADLLDGGDDVLICYADIVYEPRVLRAIADCGAAISTTVDRCWLKLWQLRLDDPLTDAETLKLDGDGDIVELGSRADSYNEIEGQYMGLIKVRADFASGLVEAYRRLDPDGDYEGRDLRNMYMTSFLQRLIDGGHRLRAVIVESGWLEVDRVADLEVYERLAEAGRLGEFWRPVDEQPTK
jgi:choline kinase